MKENDGDAMHQQSQLKNRGLRKIDIGGLKIERSIAALLTFGIHMYRHKDPKIPQATIAKGLHPGFSQSKIRLKPPPTQSEYSLNFLPCSRLRQASSLRDKDS
ncbi:MAG: hypothetical protein V4660_09280 [Pseudomonadota bacterium]